MPEGDPSSKPNLTRSTDRFLEGVAASEARMLRRKRQGTPSIWRTVGLMGLIGWSVVLPMLVGIAIGTWIDHKWPTRFSFTLMLLVAGLAAGCWNAWKRIKEEKDQ